MNAARLLSIVLTVVAMTSLAACGGDDSGDSAAPTATAVAGSPAPDPRSTPSLAQVIAGNPQYFVYIVSPGDTLASVADAFDGQRGAPPAAFTDALKAINQLASDSLSEGQQLAIPLRLPGDLALIPDASIETAIGVGAAGGKLVLLQPSLAMRDGFQNRVVLRFVQMADGNPSSEGYGYVMDYWLADRPPFKGGGVDPEARVVEPLFSVAGGSLAALLRNVPKGPVHTFSRDGISYAVWAAPAAGKTPEAIAAMLQTAAER